MRSKGVKGGGGGGGHGAAEGFRFRASRIKAEEPTATSGNQ